ncbi:SDR family NAD(P)-dependent oxidoreductase [Streptomyces xiaopingdaonensis]|uniref:SDR family NAD(P)-dependent oxidoreductase n=1 Tax=Streptomyces xiaopingdaonensis TaxID=1565415 RepID=UPI0004945200|nr:SDR family oxidoreductase [Streptomyces xiaopingdaonensis]
MRLQGKSAVVTGGAGGIGRGITAAFLREGASVLVVDRDEEALRTAESELDAGDALRTLRCDLADPSAAEEIRAAAVGRFGGIDVLVNNAHASRQAPFAEHTQEMFALSFDTGFHATARLMQSCYPHLRERRGSVINFASGAGLDGQPNQASYAAAKEAIRGLSRVVANEWAADGINVNLISPIARTAGVDAWAKQRPEQYEQVVRKIPLGHMGDPETEIAPVAVFLASEDSAYMTGQTLMADGGTLMLR